MEILLYNPLISIITISITLSVIYYLIYEFKKPLIPHINGNWVVISIISIICLFLFLIGKPFSENRKELLICIMFFLIVFSLYYVLVSYHILRTKENIVKTMEIYIKKGVKDLSIPMRHYAQVSSLFAFWIYFIPIIGQFHLLVDWDGGYNAK